MTRKITRVKSKRREFSAEQKSDLFELLIYECKHSTHGDDLSRIVRFTLEGFSETDRKEIVNRKKDGCTPLFYACIRGNTKIVEYLITVCGADVESKGYYEVPGSQSLHYVTPLWCAAVSGKLSILISLISHGADINSVSDSGSTPIRSACYKTYFYIVEYLLMFGADASLPNYHGSTCLINSIQSIKLCEKLLKHGVNVNAQDKLKKTALHYAISEHQINTVKLLLRYGADPYIRNIHNDDALRKAALVGAIDIMHYLLDNFKYSKEEIVDAYKLLGCANFGEAENFSSAFSEWRSAISSMPLDLSGNTECKHSSSIKHEVFGDIAEFQTIEELDRISHNNDMLRAQSILILERILGRYHVKTLFHLTLQGAMYADEGNYRKCLDIWKYSVKIKIERDSILNLDFNSQSLVKQLVFLTHNRQSSFELKFCDISNTFYLLTAQLEECQELLTVKPVSLSQQESFDGNLKCIIVLLCCAVALNYKTKNNYDDMMAMFYYLVKKKPALAISGDTPLHLCIRALYSMPRNILLEESDANVNELSVHYHFDVIKNLLKVGADPNVKNNDGFAPLHVATNEVIFHVPLVQLLLKFGSHIDQPDRNGSSSVHRIVAAKALNEIPVMDHISLKCLAARVIVDNSIPFELMPSNLAKLIHLHQNV